MSSNKDIFAPPTEDELKEVQSSSSDVFAPPTEEELAGPSLSEEIQDGAIKGAKIATGAAVGGGIGYAASKGAAASVGKGIESYATKVSKKTPEEMQFLLDNYNQYKKADNFEDVLNNFKDILNQKNQSINAIEKEAYSKMTAPFSRDEYLREIKSGLENKIKPVTLSEKDIADAEAKINKNVVDSFKSTEDKIKDLDNLINQRKKENTTKLVEIFPELEGKIISGPGEDIDDRITRVIKTYREGDKLEGTQLYQLIKDLRQQEAAGNEFAGEIQKGLRDKFGKLNPEAGKLLTQEHEMLKDLDKLDKNINSGSYITRSGNRNDADFIKIEPKNTAKIKQDVSKVIKDKVLDTETRKNLDNLKSMMPEDQFKSLQVAVARGDISPKKLTEVAKDAVTKAVAIGAPVGYFNPAAGITAGTIAASSDVIKQMPVESVKFGRGLAKSKLIPGIGTIAGGLIGASLAASDAKAAVDEGIINPIEGAGLVAAEAINPLPVDAAGGYIAGKRTYKQTGSVAEGLKIGGKAAIAPAVALGEVINQAGINKSESARAQMEAQQKRLDDLLKKQQQVKENPTKQLVKPVEQYQNLLNELSSMRTPTSDSLTSVLEEAAAGDEQAKARADFLIQQDPMLRRKMS